MTAFWAQCRLLFRPRCTAALVTHLKFSLFLHINSCLIQYRTNVWISLPLGRIRISLAVFCLNNRHVNNKLGTKWGAFSVHACLCEFTTLPVVLPKKNNPQRYRGKDNDLDINTNSFSWHGDNVGRPRNHLGYSYLVRSMFDLNLDAGRGDSVLNDLS